MARPIGFYVAPHTRVEGGLSNRLCYRQQQLRTSRVPNANNSFHGLGHAHGAHSLSREPVSSVSGVALCGSSHAGTRGTLVAYAFAKEIRGGLVVDLIADPLGQEISSVAVS
ncbi:unnamed protein product [Ectocarpus fasciculatus]